MNRRALGSAGEAAACAYLAERGWEIVARNLRMDRGEIDIVARRHGLTAFVEVKCRSSLSCGRPAEAVDFRKRARIVRAAALYAQAAGLTEAPLRFDVIEILPGEIRHIEDAFDASDLL